MNLPNQLTTARFFMALLFVGLMSFSNVFFHIVAYFVFTAATITDYFDGKIARDRNLVTNFGKLLDPVADKVLIIAAFLMMMENPYLRVPGWSIVVIITREFLVTGARSLAATDGAVIAANRWGKTKTVIQMVYVFVFLFFATLFLALETLWDGIDRHADLLVQAREILSLASFAGIVFVAVYTVYSGIQFARVNWGILNIGKA